MASGYARSRPALHGRVIARIRDHLRLNEPISRALDVGCGAGLSTAALQPLAASPIGVEPVAGMLAWVSDTAPAARFAAARAENLPFRSGCMDLVTAAGSL